MDSVVQLVNRLQSAATLLGDNAASAGDKSLPSLWDLLPSIVVIGGQVRPRCEGAAAALAVAQDARCGSGFPALTAPRPARAELGQELGAGGSGRQGLPAARHGDRHAPPARAAARAPGRPGGARVWRVPAQQSREDVQLWCARTPRPAPRCARALECLRAAAPRARSLAARMRACPSTPQRRGLLRTSCSGRHCVPIAADCCRSVSAAAALCMVECGPCLGAGRGAAPDGLPRAQTRSETRSRRRPGGT